MAELSNPMRFTIRPRTVDIENYLRHEDFDDKHVTEIEIEPGQMYVHWEYDDKRLTDE